MQPTIALNSVDQQKIYRHEVWTEQAIRLAIKSGFGKPDQRLSLFQAEQESRPPVLCFWSEEK